ncbi:hypothetical protein [Paenibacillus tyrfis]|uniref:hypothetical protein n=1 Tax=Paenibacillus tyrfis TaxID=1501230 RepID=UPI0020A171BF|nr:hypothetical protein [Paenibacillus tyrfis]MCP1308908.1 hypothetical protein [Paenibacillus tyrfis]
MIRLDKRIAKKTQNPERRHLTRDEKRLAHQHLNDLAARKSGDSAAAQRLSNFREHPREDGWMSLDLVEENSGISNKMRLLYKEVIDGIEWIVIQNH